MRLPLLLVLAAASSALASGCVREGGAEAPGPLPPPVTSAAHFEVVNVTVRPQGDPNRTVLYEDDVAVVRYVVRQPADASRESAFVTYILDGRIADVQQLTLSAGEERPFERVAGEVRAKSVVRVEVRAGGAIGRAIAEVTPWPRAGSDALTLGPLELRSDFPPMDHDSRVLVNVTLENRGGEPVSELRVRMLCADPAGAVTASAGIRLSAPAAGERTAREVLLSDCDSTRYGLAFTATAADGRPLAGRLLLVPRGWTPIAQP